MVDEFRSDKVVDKELVVSEKFLEKCELGRFLIVDDVFNDEVEPLGDVHLKLGVVADQFLYHFINGVVEV